MQSHWIVLEYSILSVEEDEAEYGRTEVFSAWCETRVQTEGHMGNADPNPATHSQA